MGSVDVIYICILYVSFNKNIRFMNAAILSAWLFMVTPVPWKWLAWSGHSKSLSNKKINYHDYQEHIYILPTLVFWNRNAISYYKTEYKNICLACIEDINLFLKPQTFICK